MNKKMRLLPAEFVEEGQFILAAGSVLMKILSVEWPYAVVREYLEGEFGQRSFVKLDGRYHIPSKEFLQQLGLCKKSDDPLYVLLDDEEAATLPESREPDASHCPVS